MSSQTPSSAVTASPARRVVVTGGARGIGAGVARRFAADGAQVVVADVLVTPGAALAAEIGGQFVELDLLAPDAAELLQHCVDLLGGIDVLVTSAGVLHLGTLLETDRALWDRVFAINTTGTFLAMQVAARSMIAAGTGGSIVAIASMAAKKGGGGEGAYAASKHAVVGLTRAGAQEWGQHGVRVNAVCPGYVLTEMGADTRTPDDVALWSSYSPLGRLGQPEDVAGVVAFLASPDGSYLTGQALNVTGGMVMH